MDCSNSNRRADWRSRLQFLCRPNRKGYWPKNVVVYDLVAKSGGSLEGVFPIETVRQRELILRVAQRLFGNMVEFRTWTYGNIRLLLPSKTKKVDRDHFVHLMERLLRRQKN